ncbi:hypothetical protein VNO77_43539 [Canavalia gladiata]|uniref:Uncharacterized protein n=1 Tax=Canavalia gladiata TaxID=3824 RepID=A0AAN9JXA5_CANGL
MHGNWKLHEVRMDATRHVKSFGKAICSYYTSQAASEHGFGSTLRYTHFTRRLRLARSGRSYSQEIMQGSPCRRKRRIPHLNRSPRDAVRTPCSPIPPFLLFPSGQPLATCQAAEAFKPSSKPSKQSSSHR